MSSNEQSNNNNQEVDVLAFLVGIFQKRICEFNERYQIFF